MTRYDDDLLAQQIRRALRRNDVARAWRLLRLVTLKAYRLDLSDEIADRAWYNLTGDYREVYRPGKAA